MVVGGGELLHCTLRVGLFHGLGYRGRFGDLRHRSGLWRRDITPICVEDYSSRKFVKSLGHGYTALRKAPAKQRRSLPVTNSRKLAHSRAQLLAPITAAFEVIADDIIGLQPWTPRTS
jgi:hypothetical protein